MRIEIKLKITWWVRPYLLTVETFAAMFGVEPDSDKVAQMLTRLGGIKVEIS